MIENGEITCFKGHKYVIIYDFAKVHVVWIGSASLP
jgi:hypothetical protein